MTTFWDSNSASIIKKARFCQKKILTAKYGLATDLDLDAEQELSKVETRTGTNSVVSTTLGNGQKIIAELIK